MARKFPKKLNSNSWPLALPWRFKKSPGCVTAPDEPEGMVVRYRRATRPRNSRAGPVFSFLGFIPAAAACVVSGGARLDTASLRRGAENVTASPTAIFLFDDNTRQAADFELMANTFMTAT